jgi:uncharacterized protein (TIGR03118 family)
MTAFTSAFPSVFSKVLRLGLPLAALALSLGFAGLAFADRKGPNSYAQTNLVSNLPGVSETGQPPDPDLVNGWGVAFNPNAFVWVADNGSGKSTLYDGNGVKQGLIVTIPSANGTDPGTPTGITFNTTPDFLLNGAPAAFLWATEDGLIAAWNGGNLATRVFPAAGVTPTAVYKGIAIAANGTAHQLYAADFHNKKIDVFSASFQTVVAPGGFVDPNIPSSFGPFNIMNIQGDLYVAYAMKEEDGDDEVAGAGLGFVDVFDPDGVLLRRVATHGKLNAPWGMALAPTGFGAFGNALIVGNFGDGAINAFDLKNGTPLGQLRGSDGQTLKIGGLWGIAFGNGVKDQPTDVLFFAAGPDGESNGLYGFIAPAPSSSGDGGHGH